MDVDPCLRVCACRYLLCVFLHCIGVCVCMCVCMRVCVCVCVRACVCVCVSVMHCSKPMCTTTLTYHVLLNIRTEYMQALQSLAFDSPEQESLPKVDFLANCLPPHLPSYNQHYHMHLPQPHIYITTTTTTTTTTITTQCKLLYAQVVLGKRPPAQVAEGNHHKCR